MPTTAHVSARIEPWDDPAFVKAFEHARDEVAQSGCCPDGPTAAAQVERRLHEAGYRHARVGVERTVDEALAHVSHWHVRRDG